MRQGMEFLTSLYNQSDMHEPLDSVKITVLCYMNTLWFAHNKGKL